MIEEGEFVIGQNIWDKCMHAGYTDLEKSDYHDNEIQPTSEYIFSNKFYNIFNELRNSWLLKFETCKLSNGSKLYTYLYKGLYIEIYESREYTNENCIKLYLCEKEPPIKKVLCFEFYYPLRLREPCYYRWNVTGKIKNICIYETVSFVTYTLNLIKQKQEADEYDRKVRENQQLIERCEIMKNIIKEYESEKYDGIDWI